MPLRPRARLGPYEIAAQLGATLEGAGANLHV